MISIRKTTVLATSAVLAGLACGGLLPADNLPIDKVTESGLTIHWQSQIQADTSQDKVVDLYLHVHDDRATSYYEVRHDGHRETIGFDDLSPRGEPLGKEGAAEFARLRKEILEAEGSKDVTVSLITTPETSIYAMSGFGDVHAIDAETGRTRWSTTVGTPLQPSIGLAANNRYVVALKGSTLYCLDAETGDELWSRMAHYAPGGGVAISEHMAYVTSVEGKLQMFPLDNRGLPEKFFSSTGPATRDPTVSPNTVSWATERGFFNVASADEDGRFLYRLKTDEQFLASGTQAGDNLICVSVYGKVYAIHEKDGVLTWEMALGEPVSTAPVYLGDNRVALISNLNHLIMIDVKRGQLVSEWPRTTPGIREFVGASGNVLYFLDVSGHLVGLRRDTGSQVLQTSVGDRTRVLTNLETDRMYLTDDSGRLACLRELANVNPVVHGGDEVPAGADKDQANPFAGQDQPADSSDRFGKSTDPFGDDTPPADPDDPFGGDNTTPPDDPFAGDADGGGDDPFAGDSPDDAPGGDNNDPDDPFGGG